MSMLKNVGFGVAGVVGVSLLKKDLLNTAF